MPTQNENWPDTATSNTPWNDHDDDVGDGGNPSQPDALDEALLAATATLDQYELFPEPSGQAMKGDGGTTRFRARGAGLEALVEKASLYPSLNRPPAGTVEAPTEHAGRLEILSTRIRLTTERGILTCRATLPIVEGESVSLQGSPAFRIDCRAVGRLGKALAETACDIRFDERKHSIIIQVQKANEKATVKDSYEFVADPLPASSSCAWESASREDHGKVDPILIARSLSICRTAGGLGGKRTQPLVIVKDGVASCVHEPTATVVRTEKLKDVHLMIPASACDHAARVLRHMRSGPAWLYETSKHYVIEDGRVELAIEKTPGAPPAPPALIDKPAHKTICIRADEFCNQVNYLSSIQIAESRARKHSNAGAHGNRSASTGGSLLMKISHQEGSILVISYNGHSTKGLAKLQGFHLSDLAMNQSSGGHPGKSIPTDANASTPDEKYVVWGYVSTQHLSKRLAQLRRAEVLEIQDHGNHLRIKATEGDLLVTHLFGYSTQNDIRFQRGLSKP